MINRNAKADGFFYIGTLIPNEKMFRFKVGFSNSGNIISRQQDHRCTTPEFTLVKLYASMRDWEKIVIAALTKANHISTHVKGEVFETDNIQTVTDWLDQFFGFLPTLDTQHLIKEKQKDDELVKDVKVKEFSTCMSVTNMAKKIGLSRSHFHALMKDGFFPQPKRMPDTNRPYFDSDLQDICRRVCITNVGANGKPILFYNSRKVI